jgi:DNA polymerase-2
LDTAAKEFLDEGKDIEGFDKYEQLRDAYHNDTQTLIDYNIKDAQLAYDIIYEAGVLQLTIQRSLIAGMELDRVKASVASLDNLYLRALRERGYVAPTNHYKSRERRITGGHVMKSVPGLFDYVIVCDFASLYPSIMRTFNIDPLSYVSPDEACDDCIEAPNGARYRREKGIIPDLLEQLWNKRDQAREEGNELQSNAIKVLMNSVFGVLANPNCRFYNFEMANSITTFGQHLLKVTAEQIEDEGYDVIYGDTDSIFVDLDVTSYDTASEIGHRIESYVNSFFDSYVEDEFGVESYIKLEFEKTYRKFFMPKIRGKESGAKKRYAGEIVYEDGTMEMDYVGLEIVRRDWTDLAKEFQAGLIRKVFDDEDYRSFVKEYVDDLKAGELDDKLTYRKGLTKAPEDYVKTTPPHVKAAMKMDEVDTSVIEYIQTVDGPEPVEGVEHSIDYEHYIEKQLKPIANQVLLFFDTRFDDVLKGTHQASLDGF